MSMSVKVKDLIEKCGFEAVNIADGEKEASGIFCCDLLSIAMSKAPASSAWITVMGNVNAVAVSVLTDISCIILAEGVCLDDTARERAVQQNVNVLKSDLPIYEISVKISGAMNE